MARPLARIARLLALPRPQDRGLERVASAPTPFQAGHMTAVSAFSTSSSRGDGLSWNTALKSREDRDRSDPMADANGAANGQTASVGKEIDPTWINKDKLVALWDADFQWRSPGNPSLPLGGVKCVPCGPDCYSLKCVSKFANQ